jgi:hypothetical protein
MAIVTPPPRSSLDTEFAMKAWLDQLRDTINRNYAVLDIQELSSSSNANGRLGTFLNYNEYQIKLTNVTVSAGCILNLRFSDDNNATFEQGASDYQWGIDSEVFDATPASSLTVDLADSEITLMEEQASNTSHNLLNGTITIYKPGDSTHYTMAKWDLIYNNNAGELVSAKGQGYRGV